MPFVGSGGARSTVWNECDTTELIDWRSGGIGGVTSYSLSCCREVKGRVEMVRLSGSHWIMRING